MFLMHYALFFVLFASSISGAKLPSFIQPCKSIETECMTKTAQAAIPYFAKGIPEMGIPVLDPFDIDELKVALPAGLSFRFHDGAIQGISGCKAELIQVNLNESRIYINLRCNLTMKGKYTAKGKLLLFEIDGDGDAKIKAVNLGTKVIINSRYEEDANGVKYLTIKDYTYKVDFGDKMTFRLTNLFKKDPELSQTIVKFMNDNWMVVAEELGHPVVKFAVDLALKYVSKFFASVPAKELFDPPLIL